MPYKIIEAREYECIRCKYKWMNRKNGEEKPAPKYCPLCKSSLWDTERVDYSLTGMQRFKKQADEVGRWYVEHPEEWERRLKELET